MPLGKVICGTMKMKTLLEWMDVRVHSNVRLAQSKPHAPEGYTVIPITDIDWGRYLLLHTVHLPHSRHTQLSVLNSRSSRVGGETATWRYPIWESIITVQVTL